MENTSYFSELYILPFASQPRDKPFIFGVFLLIYILGVIVNVTSISVIYIDPRLHNPMFLFLCMLSIVDISYTTVIIPRLLDMLLSLSNKVSLKQCFSQIFFFFLASGSEDILLFVMAYDRYVAICNPLHYNQILNKKNCILITVGIWISGSLNSLLLTMSGSSMSFCRFNTIQQIYCDPKSLTRIACAGTELFYMVMYLEILIFGIGPFLCSLTSYLKIIRIILRMKSKDGRMKVFSTCSSHLAVLLLYYGTAVSAFMMPSTKPSYFLNEIFTAFYATITPILNPLIYSLRNKEVKRALLRLVRAQKGIGES